MIYEFSFKTIYIKLHQGRIWFIIMIVFFRSLECCQIGHGIPNIKPRLFVLIRPYWTKVEFQQYNFEREQDIHSYLVWQFLFKGNFKACLKHWRLQKRKSQGQFDTANLVNLQTFFFSSKTPLFTIMPSNLTVYYVHGNLLCELVCQYGLPYDIDVVWRRKIS